MKILVCGSSNWRNKDKIIQQLDWLNITLYSTIIHTGETYTDKVATEYANEHSVAIEIYKANYTKHGRAAWAIRNQNIINSKIDIVLCFQIDRSEEIQNIVDLAVASKIGAVVLLKNINDTMIKTIWIDGRAT